LSFIFINIHYVSCFAGEILAVEGQIKT